MPYYSQIGQDKWVNDTLKGKTNGFFIELGACDGLYLSNTLYFEKEKNWNGICIEPNSSYFSRLCKNRKCLISNDLIYSHKDMLVEFSECEAVSGIINKETGPFTEKKHIVKKYTALS